MAFLFPPKHQIRSQRNKNRSVSATGLKAQLKFFSTAVFQCHSERTAKTLDMTFTLQTSDTVSDYVQNCRTK